MQNCDFGKKYFTRSFDEKQKIKFEFTDNLKSCIASGFCKQLKKKKKSKKKRNSLNKKLKKSTDSYYENLNHGVNHDMHNTSSALSGFPENVQSNTSGLDSYDGEICDMSHKRRIPNILLPKLNLKELDSINVCDVFSGIQADRNKQQPIKESNEKVPGMEDIMKPCDEKEVSINNSDYEDDDFMFVGFGEASGTRLERLKGYLNDNGLSEISRNNFNFDDHNSESNEKNYICKNANAEPSFDSSYKQCEATNDLSSGLGDDEFEIIPARGISFCSSKKASHCDDKIQQVAYTLPIWIIEDYSESFEKLSRDITLLEIEHKTSPNSRQSNKDGPNSSNKFFEYIESNLPGQNLKPLPTCSTFEDESHNSSDICDSSTGNKNIAISGKTEFDKEIKSQQKLDVNIKPQSNEMFIKKQELCTKNNISEFPSSPQSKIMSLVDDANHYSKKRKFNSPKSILEEKMEVPSAKRKRKIIDMKTELEKKFYGTLDETEKSKFEESFKMFMKYFEEHRKMSKCSKSLKKDFENEFFKKFKDTFIESLKNKLNDSFEETSVKLLNSFFNDCGIISTKNGIYYKSSNYSKKRKPCKEEYHMPGQASESFGSTEVVSGQLDISNDLKFSCDKTIAKEDAFPNREKNIWDTQIIKQSTLPDVRCGPISKKEEVGSGSRLSKCLYCTFSSSNIIDVLDHLDSHKVASHWPCTHCSFFTTEKEQILLHLKTHTGGNHSNLSEQKPEHLKKKNTSRKKSNKKTLKCHLCPATYRCKFFFKKHLSNHTDQTRFECPICFWVCQHIMTMKTHISTHKEKKDDSLCSSSSYKATNASEMISLAQSHVKIGENTSPPNSYVCSICLSQFVGEDVLNDHMQLYHSKTLENVDVLVSCEQETLQTGHSQILRQSSRKSKYTKLSEKNEKVSRTDQNLTRLSVNLVRVKSGSPGKRPSRDEIASECSDAVSFGLAYTVLNECENIASGEQILCNKPNIMNSALLPKTTVDKENSPPPVKDSRRVLPEDGANVNDKTFRTVNPLNKPSCSSTRNTSDRKEPSRQELCEDFVVSESDINLGKPDSNSSTSDVTYLGTITTTTDNGRTNNTGLCNSVPSQSTKKDFLYECCHCDFGANKLFHLNLHLLEHSHLKPFECSFCPETFSLPIELKNHMKGHSDN